MYTGPELEALAAHIIETPGSAGPG